MLEKILTLSITTPSGKIFDDEVSYVNLPGSEGDFEVYPEHASLVSLLNAGVINIVKKDGNSDGIVIDWGYVKVEESKVSVLVDNAISLAGDSDSQISKNLESAKELLESAKSQSVDITALKARVEKVVSKY